MKTVNAAKFKETCLALLDRLEPDGLIITKRGKPIARVVPYDPAPASRIGILRGKMVVSGDIFSTGLTWKADAES